MVLQPESSSSPIPNPPKLLRFLMLKLRHIRWKTPLITLKYTTRKSRLIVLEKLFFTIFTKTKRQLNSMRCTRKLRRILPKNKNRLKQIQLFRMTNKKNRFNPSQLCRKKNISKAKKTDLKQKNLKNLTAFTMKNVNQNLNIIN